MGTEESRDKVSFSLFVPNSWPDISDGEKLAFVIHKYVHVLKADIGSPWYLKVKTKQGSDPSLFGTYTKLRRVIRTTL